MRELVYTISSTGLLPNESDLQQLWKAIQIAPWIQEYAQDTSTGPNSIIAAINPVPPSLVLGTVVRIKLANTNTGLTTFSLNSFGTYNVKKANGAALEAGDLTVGQIANLIWTGTEWQIINYLGTSAPVTSNTFNIHIPYAADTGTTANHVIANFSPDISVAAAGDIILVKAARTNTGATDIVCDVQAVKAIVRPNGTPLQAGDIVAGQMMILLFDGSGWQLCNPIFWFTDIGPDGGGGQPSGNFVPGAIYLWPTEVAPNGTLECNGSAISRTQYSRLYGIIGSMYGAGNGTTTFNLPDYRGIFPRGWDHGRGLDVERNLRTNRGDGTTGDHIGTNQLASINAADIKGEITMRGVVIWSQVALPPLDPFVAYPDSYREPGVVTTLQGLNTGSGSFGSQIQLGGASYFGAYPREITASSMSSSSGGTETRPVNINTMYIIAY